MIYKVFHKSNVKFNKFDIKYKNGSSSKFGLGLNFSFDQLPDLDLKYLYVCEVDLKRPISKVRNVISNEQWVKFLEKIGMNFYGEESRLHDDDYGIYTLISQYYSGDNQLFLNAALEILKVDGLVDRDSNILVAFNANNITIKDIVDTSQLHENYVERSRKHIEDLLGMDYDLAVQEITQRIYEKVRWDFPNIEIIGVDFYGSRRFGNPKPNSDLDVVLAYNWEPNSRRIREDDLFNCLNSEDPIRFLGYQVDVNPIEMDNEDELKNYIQNASKYKKVESLKLKEDTRAAQINKSRSAGPYKDQTYGKNRFERRLKSKIANTVDQYNKIDMNDLFKRDILTVSIPVIGETNQYLVTIRFNGVITELQRELKLNKNKFEYKLILQSLAKIFSSTDVFTKCTCEDFKYNFAHWNIVTNVSVDDHSKDPGPGRGVANPNNDKGKGCKHILLVLSNGDWLMKVASVINNYVHYMSDTHRKLFLKMIFPKLYGITEDQIVNQDLLDEETEDTILDSSEDIINLINEYGKNRGKIKKGSNRNTASTINGPEETDETDEEDNK